MKGLLNINKPTGCTSHDVIARARKILGERHIGHMGTLDPLADGVLVLGVGKAARLFDFFLAKDKCYEAQFEFGYETDTLDATGQTLVSGGTIPKLDDIIKKLSEFEGVQEQLPPKYSSKKIDGQRAYMLAREGKDFSVKPSSITVYSFRHIQQVSASTHRFKISCSGGTYIRSLARDLGYSLGSFATMTALTRTRCGDFDLNEAISLESLAVLGQKALIPCERALTKLVKVELPSERFSDLVNGRKLAGGGYGKQFLLYCDNVLFGIADDTSVIIKIVTYLKD